MAKPKFVKHIDEIELPKREPQVVTFKFTGGGPAVCDLCGEDLYPQHAASSWLGDFHQGCFGQVMRCAKVPRFIKSIMAVYVVKGIHRARREGL